jgi:sugar lactone lactonase YvrE
MIKNNRHIILKFAKIIFTIVILSSCMNDDVLRDFDRLNKNETEPGVFIINEGNFMYSNASLSYYNPKTQEIINDVFYKTNALPLGDIAQSMTINDSLGYVVVNNSGKIYIIDINTFKYVGKITGLVSPRHIYFINEQKAYISDLYSKSIFVYNPILQQVTNTINISNGNTEFSQHNSEMFVQTSNKVYVNSWSYDNKILVINSISDEIIDSITVGKQPNSMLIDKNNNLWVLSDGGFAGSNYGQENASLTQINLQTNNIIQTLSFNDIDASPNNLCINSTRDTLYFVYGNWASSVSGSGIYKMSINNTELPTSPFISTGTKTIYGLNYDNENNELYFSDAVNNTQNGFVFRFKSNGIAIDTFKVGINPNGFCFK